MICKFKEYCENNQIIDKRDCIIVGVSGGVDSMCLLSMLLKIRGEYELKLCVVHINHMIRKDSMIDANYVRDYCSEHEIEYIYYQYDVVEYSKIYKLSEEEAGRKLRYQAFGEVFKTMEKEYSSCKIAVAHNMNDRAETLLFNLARGSKLSGLRSILPVQGHIIRPILCFLRSEIEIYLLDENITPRLDESNCDLKYNRNKIRHKITPVMEELNEKAIVHMNETANSLYSIEKYFIGKFKIVEKECIQYAIRDSASINIVIFQLYDSVIQGYTVREVLYNLANSKKDITSKHVEAVLNLLDKQVGKVINLPYGLKAQRSYDKIIIYREKSLKNSSNEKLEIYIDIFPKDVKVDDKLNLDFEILQPSEHPDEFKKGCKKYFNCDKIKNTLVVRYRQGDDYIVIDDKGTKKKLNRFMIDEKIPKMMRDSIPVIADGNNIIWICDYRISSYYKADKFTKNILRITMN